jgi:hypothetical protein
MSRETKCREADRRRADEVWVTLPPPSINEGHAAEVTLKTISNSFSSVNRHWSSVISANGTMAAAETLCCRGRRAHRESRQNPLPISEPRWVGEIDCVALGPEPPGGQCGGRGGRGAWAYIASDHASPVPAEELLRSLAVPAARPGDEHSLAGEPALTGAWRGGQRLFGHTFS